MSAVVFYSSTVSFTKYGDILDLCSDFTIRGTRRCSGQTGELPVHPASGLVEPHGCPVRGEGLVLVLVLLPARADLGTI